MLSDLEGDNSLTWKKYSLLLDLIELFHKH